MKIIISTLVLLTSLSSFAECYTFINGNGPSVIGSIDLSPYRAQEICLSKVSRRGSTFSSLQLLVPEGNLLLASVEQSIGRCGPDVICKYVSGAKSGQAMGENLRSYELNSIEVEIVTELKRNINLYTGVMTDKYNGKKYLVMKK